MKLYNEPFKATGRGEDIRYINFNHLGLYKKEFFDGKGDLIKNEFYTDYDSETSIHSGLAIKEERTYARDAVTGLIIKRTTDVTWYGESGAVLEQRTSIEKIYTFQKGFVANKRARQNLLNKASIYFYSELLTAAAGDTTIADSNKNDFDDYTTNDQVRYVKSNIGGLIEKIDASTDNQSPHYKAYITQAIADTMKSILDVNYDG